MVLVLGTCASACGDDPERGQPYLPPAGDGGAETGDPQDICAGDPNPDEMSMELDDASPTDGTPQRVIPVGERFVVCGDEFVQVWDPEDGHTGGAASLSGPCRGLAKAGHERIVLTTDDELTIMQLGDDGLQTLGSLALAGGVGGVASDGTQAWVALGTAGLGVYDVATDSPASVDTWAISDARDVAATPHGLVVAAGDAGVQLWSTAGVSVATLATDSPALHVRAGDDHIAILRGAFGWDLAEVTDDELAWVATLETAGIVLDAVVSDAEVITAEAYGLVRYDTAGSVTIASVQPREGVGELDAPWIRGVARGQTHAAIVDDDSIAPLSIERMSDSPRVEVDVPSMSLWSTDGQVAEGLFVVRNAGDAPLHVRSVSADGPLQVEIDDSTLEAYDACPGQLVVDPGGSFSIEMRYAPTGEPFTSTLQIETDDPDALTLHIPVDGDRAPPQPGDEVADFAVPTLDGGTFRLSGHAGQVVFIKLFNFACSTCAEDFPLIEQQLRPAYAEDDVVMIGINTAHRTAYAADLAHEAGLSLAVGLDLDSEVFRRLRIPGAVFPLHVVIDREGRLSWVSNESGIEAVRAAIDAAL
jgi:peroxiredoxin